MLRHGEIEVNINNIVVHVWINPTGISYRPNDVFSIQVRQPARARSEATGSAPWLLLGHDWSSTEASGRSLQRFCGRLPARPTADHLFLPRYCVFLLLLLLRAVRCWTARHVGKPLNYN